MLAASGTLRWRKACLHLGCKALLGLGVYVSKALDAEPADRESPDETGEQTNPNRKCHDYNLLKQQSVKSSFAAALPTFLTAEAKSC